MSEHARDPSLPPPRLAVGEVELPVTRAQLIAQELLFRVAIGILASVHPGEHFRLDDGKAESLSRGVSEFGAKVYVGKKHGRWPGSLNGAVGLLAAPDGTAVLMMTEYSMMEAEALLQLGCGEVALADGLEMMVLRSDGRVEKGPSILTQELLAEAPRRADA